MKRDYQKYLRVARKEFCAGTGLTVPHDVVTAGLKRIDDWCRIVFDQRIKHRIPEPTKRASVRDPYTVYKGRRHSWKAPAPFKEKH